MGTKMKGLLKGLRYISQIFEEEEEPEMEIGIPTDVKHVAHIGWDGPTATAPSWMNQFKADGEPNVPPPNGPDAPESLTRRQSKHSRRHNSGGSSLDSPKRSSADSRRISSATDSPSRDSAPVPKSSRRKKSKGSNTSGSSSKTKNNPDYSDPAGGSGSSSRSSRSKKMEGSDPGRGSRSGLKGKDAKGSNLKGSKGGENGLE